MSGIYFLQIFLRHYRVHRCDLNQMSMNKALVLQKRYTNSIIHLKYMYVLALTTPNPCLPIPCQHGGVCRPVGSSKYVCECGQENGVTYRGKNCNTAVTLCDSSPCTLGHCVPTGNSYRYKVLENVSSFLYLTRI